jgi:hypothetical protein
VAYAGTSTGTRGHAGACVVCLVDAHIRQVLAASGGRVKPTALHSLVVELDTEHSDAKCFPRGAQCDVHDLLRVLTEMLHQAEMLAMGRVVDGAPPQLV